MRSWTSGTDLAWLVGRRCATWIKARADRSGIELITTRNYIQPQTTFHATLLRFRAGKSAQARKLAGLTAHHPAANGNADIQWRLKEVLPELQATLSADELAAAMERGKAFDLDTVVAELLEVFGEIRV